MRSAPWVAAVLGGGAVVGLLVSRSAPAGLLAAIAVSLAIGVWREPALGGAIVLGVVPAAAGLRRGLPVPGVRPAEVVVGGLACIVLWRMRGARLDRVDAVAGLYALAVFLLGAFDLVVVRGDPVSAGALQLLVAPVGMLLVYRTCRVALVDERWLRLGLRLALAVVPLVAIGSVLQEAGVAGVRRLLARLTAGDDYGPFGAMLDQGVARATGPFEHPQTLGAYLATMAVLVTALLVRDRPRRVAPASVLLGVLAFTAAGLAATVTAGTAIAALVGAVLVGARAGLGRRIGLAGGAIAGVGALFVAPRIARRVALQFDGTGSLVPQSLRFRLVLWRDQYLPTIRGHWLTGYGPGLPTRITFPYTESLYVSLVFRGGLLLLVVYAVLLVVALRAVRLVRPADGVGEAVRDTFLVVVVLLLPLQLLGSFWLDGGAGQLWWALLGAALAVGLPCAVREDG